MEISSPAALFAAAHTSAPIEAGVGEPAKARVELFAADGVDGRGPNGEPPLPSRGYLDPHQLRSRAATAAERSNLERGLRADGVQHLGVSGNVIDTEQRRLSPWERGFVSSLDSRVGPDAKKREALAKLLSSESFKRLPLRERSESLAIFSSAMDKYARLKNVPEYTRIVESKDFRELPQQVGGQARAFMIMTLDRPNDLELLGKTIARPEFRRLGETDQSAAMAFLCSNVERPERLEHVADLVDMKSNQHFRRLPSEHQGRAETLLYGSLHDPKRLGELKSLVTSAAFADQPAAAQLERLRAIQAGNPVLAE